MGEIFLGAFIGMVSGWVIWHVFLDKPFYKFMDKISKRK